MSNLTVTIAGSVVSIKETTLNIKHRVDDKDTATFTVTDSTGTLAFSKGQTVSIDDNVLGNLFTGYINKPTATNLYPNATNEWSVDCVNKFYVAAKKSTTNTTTKKHRGGKHVKQQSGAIVANQIQEYLEPEGVTGNFGLDWSELQTDWQTGTQSGVVATTNTSTGNEGAGDLELALAGSAVTFQQQTQADFNAGVTGGGLSSPTTGGITFTPSAAIKFQATQSIPGLSNAACYVKIWSGSYVLQANDAIVYDLWIADSSPQCLLALDVVFSDGTTMVQNINGADALGFHATPSTDLSGIAKNVWYGRAFIIGFGGFTGKTVSYVALACAGQNQGNYTAYYRNISIKNGGTTQQQIFQNTATVLPQTPQQLQNNGYSNVTCAYVTAYERHGFMFSPNFSISSAGIVQSSYLNWSITLPNTGFTYLITASIDGNATYLPCTLNGAIPGLLTGANASGKSVQIVYTFDNAGNDPTLTPFLSEIMGGVIPSYSCVKSDSITTTSNSTGWNAGTLSNLVVSGNTIALNGFARNWNDANISNQTVFGSSSPAQGTNLQQFFLTTGTGTDVRSRFDFAGSNWQNFTMEVDVTVSANYALGVVYRCTNWGNNNDSYAYSVVINTTQVQIGHGTNSTGAGSFTNISTVSTTLSSGTTYRLKVIVNGNNHQVFINDVNFINVTDSTYTAAGYVGLRIFNGSGSTQTGTFDNFGIMAALSGTWVSPAIDIHALSSISNSALNMEIDPGNSNTTTSYLAEISLNNGSTWTSLTNDITEPGGSYPTFYQATPVPGLTSGTNVSSYTQVLIRLTITSTTAATGLAMPDLTAYTLFVIGAYSSSGTRSTAPIAWDNMVRGNVVGGFGTATNGATYTKTGTGTVALTSDEATISNTTGDVHMQLGSTTQQDTDGTVRFSLSASTISAGMELRYSNANTFYRLQASTTTISIIKKAGATVTLASVAMALSTGVFYHMRFVVQGSGASGPLNLYGNIWPDGSTEPAAFTISATD